MAHTEDAYARLGGANLATEKRSDGFHELVTRLGAQYETAVALGDVNGTMSVRKYGSNPSVGVTAEFVDAAGGTYAGFLQAAATVRIQAGGNAADAAAGAGARKITVYGLDENWNLAEEDIVTAGASQSSATTTTFVRIHRVRVKDVGTYGGSNTGAIIVESSGAVVMATIAAGTGSTEMALYTIPAGYTGILKALQVEVEGTNSAEVRLWSRERADIVAAPFGPKVLRHQVRDFTGFAQIQFESRILFPEKTDIWFEATRITGGGDAEVAVEFDLELILGA